MQKIITTGDRIVFGQGERPSVGWAGRLKQEFEKKHNGKILFNLGNPSDNSTTLRERFEVEIASRTKNQHQHDRIITIIGVGLNDTKCINKPDKPSTQPAIFKKNISQLIKSSKKYSHFTIILSITPVNEKLTYPLMNNVYFSNSIINKFNQIIEEVSIQENIHYINLFEPILSHGFEELLSENGLHPNSFGYGLLFEVIKKYLEDNDLVNF